MTEHYYAPLSQPERLSDTELIDQEITNCIESETIISAACARVIASQVHGGSHTSLYSFTSTGRVDERLLTEIECEYVAFMDDDSQLTRLSFLSLYVAERWAAGDRDSQENWPALWLEQPDKEDYCPCCTEHIRNAHRVGCPLGVDEEDQLDRVLELQVQHGNPILHWLSYAGFRDLGELNQRAEQFPEYYVGLFPDLDTFRANYEVSPDAYLEQQYEIVEADGGYYVFYR